MLHVVTRHENEGLVIGESIEVTVLEITETQIRLGIASPDIEGGYREEVLQMAAQPELTETAARQAEVVAADAGLEAH